MVKHKFSRFSLPLLLLLACLPLSALAAKPMVAAGFNFALALKTDGSLSAWGRNDYGQLGNGQAAMRTTPAKVAGIDHAKAVAGGSAHTLVLQDDGTLWSFGVNSNGQLGDATIQGKSHPVRVGGIGGAVAAIAAGSAHSLAIAEDGNTELARIRGQVLHELGVTRIRGQVLRFASCLPQEQKARPDPFRL